MKLVIVRHGPAGGPAEKKRWSGRDHLRPLTAEGKEKTRRAAKGLARVAPRVDLIVTSPLARARQTADLLAKRLDARVITTDALKPEAGAEEARKWLAGRSERVLALVGHEPQLGLMIAWLCASAERPFTELKKGQACLLDWPAPRAGEAKLSWSLAPAQLRRLS